MDREKQKEEALLRLQQLEKAQKINPKIRKYFQEGRLYYSYRVDLLSDWFGCIDTIEYDQKYAELVKQFQKKYGALVYHAIETESVFGKLLSLLYVGKREENWASERLFGKDCILAYVFNLDDPDCSEFGDIFLFQDNGALLRSG